MIKPKHNLVSNFKPEGLFMSETVIDTCLAKNQRLKGIQRIAIANFTVKLVPFNY